MSKPFVTVLIDTYNHERFIEQAIVSVLEQDISPEEMEVIVVDDGSTDGTAAVVHKFAPRVGYLGKANGGQASAFNVGIPQAQGKIVAFLDGDDWWAKDKLQTVLEVLERNPEVGAVGHGYYEVYGLAPRHGVVLPEKTYRLGLGDAAAARLFSQLRCFLGTSRITVRKAVLDRILPIPEELVVEADEFLFTLIAAIAGAIVLDQPLCCYRLHSDNLFQFQDTNPVKLRRKSDVMACLAHELPRRLKGVGVPQDALDALVTPVWVEAESLRLALDGGKPWETFRVESVAYRLAYKNVNVWYRIFKTLVFGLTLVLPPRRFYQLKRWYTAKGLRKLRKMVGEPKLAAPIVERRPEVSSGRAEGK